MMRGMTSSPRFGACCNLLLAYLVACATGEDAGEDSATPTTGDPVTSTFTTTTDPSLSTTDDPTNDATSTTDEPADSSTSGTVDAPSECPVGTMDCPCDAKAACDAPLACVEELCVPPMCAEDLGEPNDFRSDAVELGMISDDPDETLAFAGVLDGTDDGPADEDWFTYQGIDGLGETVAPGIALTVDSGTVEVCQFFACNSGDPQVACPEGTSAVVERGIDGCCGATGFDFGDDDVLCVAGGFETSGTVWIAVRNGSAQCVEYEGVVQF
jgi:hypothetical protein